MWRLGFILILKLFEGGARRPKVYTLTESISTSNCSSAQPKSFSLIDISLFSFVSYISLLSTITASDKKKINKINRKRMMLPHCSNLNSWFLRIFCFVLSFIYFIYGLFMLCYFLKSQWMHSIVGPGVLAIVFLFLIGLVAVLFS